MTVQDLADRFQVPERTIRRWIDLHGSFLGARKEGRRLLVPEDSLTVAETIKKLYEGGATASQVNDVLRGAKVPQVIDVTPVTPAQAESLVKELIAQMKAQSAEMNELRNEMRQIREFLLTQSAPAATTDPVDRDSPTNEPGHNGPTEAPEKKPGFLVRAWRAFWGD